MLTKQVDECDRIEILSDGTIQVREATSIVDNGVPDPTFEPVFHRYVLAPGDDTTGKHPRIIAVAAAVWTKEVIAQKAANKAKGGV